MQLFENLMTFGIAAGLLMVIGLAVVVFFNWVDRETKPQ